MNIPKIQRVAPHVRYPFGVRGAIFSVMAIGLAGAMITYFTGAVFTDTASSSSNVFTSGARLDLQISDNGGSSWGDSVTANLSSGTGATAMVPGDAIWGAIDLKNTNSYDILYSMTSQATSGTDYGGGTSSPVTNDFGKALHLKVFAGGTTCAAGGVDNGTSIYDDVLVNPAGGTQPIFGTETLNTTTDDRSIAGTETEALCLNIAFPIDNTDQNALGGMSQTLKFNFVAQQKANNP